MTGIDDVVFNRFLELCDSHGISPMAQNALVEFLYETYYLGHDNACKQMQYKQDLKVGIENWKKELKQREENEKR
ncbi:hypothetical protein b3_0116 [Synechococcus phage B3]|nr:hypothetical protein b3_0116 [Synechococcus phage B3]QGT54730.1 hypothetical protein b23_0115 [Synechococcus phage B23]